jgi:hypothetical protein
VAVPSPPPEPFIEVFLPVSPRDSIAGWYRYDQTLPDSAPALLYLHGNGENLATMHRWGLFDRLSALGVHVLAIDYPGYGRSTGTPSEQSVGRGCDEALRWLAGRHERGDIIVCGWSLGAAAVIGTAARNPELYDRLIAMSPWTTVSDVAARFYPRFLVKLVLNDHYNSLEAVRGISSPLLIIHGREDTLIPHSQGERLKAAAPDGVRWVSLPGTGHNDLPDDPRVWDAIETFIQTSRR